MKQTNLKAFKQEVKRNYEMHFSNRHARVNLSSFCNRLGFDLNGARVYQTETPYTHNRIFKDLQTFEDINNKNIVVFIQSNIFRYEYSYYFIVNNKPVNYSSSDRAYTDGIDRLHSVGSREDMRKCYGLNVFIVVCDNKTIKDNYIDLFDRFVGVGSSRYVYQLGGDSYLSKETLKQNNNIIEYKPMRDYKPDTTLDKSGYNLDLYNKRLESRLNRFKNQKAKTALINLDKSEDIQQLNNIKKHIEVKLQTAPDLDNINEYKNMVVLFSEVLSDIKTFLNRLDSGWFSSVGEYQRHFNNIINKYNEA